MIVAGEEETVKLEEVTVGLVELLVMAWILDDGGVKMRESAVSSVVSSP